MILVRLLLIILIIYLLVRGILKSLNSDYSQRANNNDTIRDTEKPQKKVSRSVGEYIDYEEEKKKD